MNKYLRHIFAFVLLLLATGLFANNDSINIANSMNLPDKVFFDEVYTNPAAVFLRPDAFDHGKIDFAYGHTKQKDFGFIQDGEQLNSYKISAKGFSVKDNKIFWGNIGYNNFKKKNVQWSNVYNYEKLGPYIVADSIGGNPQGEEYNLSGGLSIRTGKWTFGGQAGYIAGQSYRTVDPRPQAISTDMFLQLGISYNVFNNYETGFSLNANKFREKIDTKVEKKDLSFTFYPLKGFGQYDLRQIEERSRSFSWLYEGQKYGGAFFVSPQNQNGLLANLAFNYEIIDSNIGNNNTPYTYKTYTTNAVLGWQKWQLKNRSFVKLNFDYMLGKGTERVYYYMKINEIFGENVLLYSARFYTKKTSNIALSGGHEWISTKNIKWITANIAYSSYEEKYAFPQYKIKTDRVVSSIEVGGEFRTKGASTFIPKIAVSYSPSLSSESVLPENQRIFDMSVKPNLAYMEADLLGVNASLTYEYKLKKTGSLFTSLNSAYLTDKDNNRYHIGVSVGVKY